MIRSQSPCRAGAAAGEHPWSHDSRHAAGAPRPPRQVLADRDGGWIPLRHGSYATYIPAAGCTPVGRGIANRTNVLSEVGMAVAAYGAVRVFAGGAGGPVARIQPKPARCSPDDGGGVCRRHDPGRTGLGCRRQRAGRGPRAPRRRNATTISGNHASGLWGPWVLEPACAGVLRALRSIRRRATSLA
jgi:hypothetical protein